jgi:hypothetical protein
MVLPPPGTVIQGTRGIYGISETWVDDKGKMHYYEVGASEI